MTDRRSVVISVLDTSSNTSTRLAPIGPAATEGPSTRRPASRSLPPAINQGQAYYWSYAWQVGEQESRAELAAGHGKTFDNAEDAIRWLLSNDE